MITLTVKDVLDENIPNADNHFLYRFSDEETTFYVGQSYSIEDRMLEHLGIISATRSGRFLRLVEANMPEANDWTITLYTVQDCEQFIRASYAGQGWDIDRLITYPDPTMAVNMAERSLMNHYNPCLNVTYNKQKTPIPKKYKW